MTTKRMSLAEFYRRLSALRGEAYLDTLGYIRFSERTVTVAGVGIVLVGEVCPVERVDDAGRRWMDAGKALGLDSKDVSDIIDAADNFHASGCDVDFKPRVRRIRRAMLNALGL